MRALRWKRMLESGEFAMIAELAEREGIASSYMIRVLRLTLLALDIFKAILAVAKWARGTRLSDVVASQVEADRAGYRACLSSRATGQKSQVQPHWQ